MLTTTERQERTDHQKQEGFTKFLADPLVRIALSSVPQGEHQDNIRLVLKAAFDSGFNAGTASVAGDIIEMMIKDRKAQEDF